MAVHEPLDVQPAAETLAAVSAVPALVDQQAVPALLPTAMPQEVVDEVTMAVATLDAKLAYARLLVKSSLVPDALKAKTNGKVDPEATLANVFVVMEYGKLLNLAPVLAMSEINVVKGKAGMSAKLMRAKVREAGHDPKILTPPDKRSEECTVQIILADGRSSEPFTFTVADAVAMGLCRLGPDGKIRVRDSKGNPLPWESMTSTMLLERATSFAVRGTCPEVLMGVAYTFEELEAMMGDSEPELVESTHTPERELAWPADYEDDTSFVNESRTPEQQVNFAKKTLATLAGDNATAAKLWADHFEQAQFSGLRLGHLRRALGLKQAGGDGSGVGADLLLKGPGPAGEADEEAPDGPTVSPEDAYDAATAHQDVAGDVAPIDPPVSAADISRAELRDYLAGRVEDLGGNYPARFQTLLDRLSGNPMAGDEWHTQVLELPDEWDDALADAVKKAETTYAEENPASDELDDSRPF